MGSLRGNGVLYTSTPIAGLIGHHIVTNTDNNKPQGSVHSASAQCALLTQMSGFEPHSRSSRPGLQVGAFHHSAATLQTHTQARLYPFSI